MFDFMRKHAASIIIFVVIFFAGTIFLVWGMGNEKRDENFAAKINGQPISLSRYSIALDNKRKFYRNIYKDRFTPALEKELNLKEKTLDDLIAVYLLKQQARKEGLSISDKELKTRIRSYPAFQENGVFSARRYKQILDWNRTSPAQFEEQERQSMLVQKMTNLIQEQVKVSKAELLEEYRQSHAKIKLKYLHFTPDIFKDQVEITDQELNNYFNEHIEEYRQAERRKVAYLLLNYRKLDPGTIEENTIKEYYENNKTEFHQDEQVRASHILLKVAPGASTEEKEKIKSAAQKLLDRAKKGEDFAKLAKENSEDKGSAAKGGDLGYFGRGQMVPSFEEAAFALKKGESSDLVESPYGYHILKHIDTRGERTKTFPEVHKEIENKLKDEKRQEMASDLAEETHLQLSEGKTSWEAIAAKEEWEAKESNLFSQEEGVIGIFPDMEFKDAAFSLGEEDISIPVKINDGITILKLLERKDSYLPELTEVKDKVEKTLREEKASILAKEKAEQAVEKFKQGTAFDQLAEKMEVKETDFVTQRDFVPQIGPISKFALDLFFLAKGEISAPLLLERAKEKSYVLFLLEDKQEADEKDFKKEEEQMRTQLLATKQEQAMQNWVEALKEKSSIEINQRILD